MNKINFNVDCISRNSFIEYIKFLALAFLLCSTLLFSVDSRAEVTALEMFTLTDGTGPFSAVDAAGDDASANNEITRTHDEITYRTTIVTNGGDENTTITLILPTIDAGVTAGEPAATWREVPPQCTGANSLLSTDGLTLTCDLGNLPNSATLSIEPIAVVSGRAPNGQEIDLAAGEGSVSATSDQSGTVDAVYFDTDTSSGSPEKGVAAADNTLDQIVSAAPRFDLSHGRGLGDTVSQQGVIAHSFNGGTGPSGEDGLALAYSVFMFAREIKGSEMINPTSAFGYTHSLAPGGANPIPQTALDAALYINFAGPFGNQNQNLNPGCKNGSLNRFATPGDTGPTGSTSVANVANGGAITCTQTAAGEDVIASVSGIDSSLAHFPTLLPTGGGTNPADLNQWYVMSKRSSLFIPLNVLPAVDEPFTINSCVSMTTQPVSISGQTNVDPTPYIGTNDEGNQCRISSFERQLRAINVKVTLPSSSSDGSEDFAGQDPRVTGDARTNFALPGQQYAARMMAQNVGSELFDYSMCEKIDNARQVVVTGSSINNLGRIKKEGRAANPDSIQWGVRVGDGAGNVTDSWGEYPNENLASSGGNEFSSPVNDTATLYSRAHCPDADPTGNTEGAPAAWYDTHQEVIDAGFSLDQVTMLRVQGRLLAGQRIFTHVDLQLRSNFRFDASDVVLDPPGTPLVYSAGDPIEPGQHIPNWMSDRIFDDAGTLAFSRIHNRDVIEVGDQRYLRISKSASPADGLQVAPGQTVEYTVQANYTTSHVGTPADITVTDILPPALLYLATSSGPMPTVQADTPAAGFTTLSWVLQNQTPVSTNIGGAAGNLAPIVFTARVATDLTTDHQLFNWTTLSDGGLDADFDSDCDYDAGNDPEAGYSACTPSYSTTPVKADNTVHVVSAPPGFQMFKEVLNPVIYPTQSFTHRINWASIAAQTPDLRVLDIFPWDGDARGTSFNGTIALSSATPTGALATDMPTLYYTSESPEFINADPFATDNALISAGIWCDTGDDPVTPDVGSAGCPATIGDATALIVDQASILQDGVTYSVELTFMTSGNSEGDIYANNHTANDSGSGLDLLTGNTVQTTVAEPSVGGIVWQDYNADGVKDPGEPGIPMLTVNLTGTDIDGAAVNLSVNTDVNGNYLFNATAGLIKPSNATGYTVTATQPTGLSQTFDLDDGALYPGPWVTPNSSGAIVITASDDRLDVNFGYAAFGTITVNKALVGEDSATAWQFNLTSEVADCVIPTSVINPAATPSGGAGSASFVDLPLFSSTSGAACTYEVSEIRQPRYEIDTDNTDTLTGLSPTATTPASVRVTNVQQVGDLKVIKEIDGIGQLDGWEFTVATTDTVNCALPGGLVNPATTNAMGEVLFTGLSVSDYSVPTSPTPCEYTVTETPQTGYEQISILPAGPYQVNTDTVTAVTVTNKPLESDLKLTKTVETNATGNWSFDFTLSPTATTTDTLPITGSGTDSTEITWSALIPGTPYTISEVTAGLTGYTAGTMTCSSLVGGQLVALTDLETNQTDASFQFVAPLGDENMPDRTFEIECTITNQQWPDLVVTKTVDPAAAKAGDPVTFTVGVTNQGILPATEVELTDILPDGLVYVNPNPTPSQGTYTSADGIWDVGELVGSASASLEFATTIEPVAGECEVDYTNTVSVTKPLVGDFDTTNHSAEAMCHLVSVALAKQHISSTAVGSGEVGDFRYQVVYELLAVNNGGVDLTNVQIIDDLNQIINDPNDNDATIVPGSVSVAYVDGVALPLNTNYDGTTDANLLVGNGDLAVGSEAKFTITFEMLVDVYFGDFTNQATITAMAGDVAVEDLSEDGPAVTNGSRLFSANAVTNDAGCVQDSPTVFRLNIPATPATINWFKANDLGGIVAFDWTSGAEIANAGFIIEAQDEEGSWNPVSELIPSQGDATVEQHYQHEVVTSATVFRLVDVDISGKRTEHGPYELDTDYGQRSPRKATDWDAIEQDSDAARETREQRLREQLREKLQQSAPTTYWFRAPQSEPATPVLEENRMQPTNTQPDSWLSRVKTGAVGLLALGLNSLVPSAHALDVAALDIHTSGVYKVRHQDLLNAGIDLSGISKNQIGIRHVEHGSVPVKVTGGSNFGNNGTITFAAYDLTTTYVDKNTYVLTVNEGQVEIGTDDGAIPNGPAAYSYLAHKRHAPQNHYSHTSPDRHDAWYAESLKAISRPASTDITLEVDGYAPVVGSTSSTGSGAQSAVARPTLQLDLWGASNPKGDGVANPDHHVTVDLNGERIQDIRFDGLQVKQTEQVLDNLASGTQSITLSLPKSHGYAFDFVRLDEIAISYPRKFWAEQSKHLVFDSEWNKFLVRKLNSETNVEVYRMNAQGDVDQITQTQGKGCTNGQCRVMFKGADEKGQLHRYFVSSAPRTPGIRLVDPDMAPIAGQVDHILIAHSDFINNSQLQAYANQLQANGDTVEIVDVAGIYARYTGHIVDASAIQAYIQEAYELRGTRNISLIGDDNYDYHNNLGTNAQSFIPSLYVRIAQNVNAVPSDPKYADIDDDNIPDLGITRLPVRSNTELNRILAKHSAYQNRSYSNKTLFAADEQENSGYSFKADAEAIKASFNGWQASTAYMDDMTPTQASQTVVNQINQGVSLTHYFGHGNTDRWGRNDALLVGEQVGNLINQGKPTVVLQWACWNNFYVNPQEDALGHRFLTESENGAVTVMGATSLTTADAEQALAQKLYAHLHQGKSIAKAVLDAKRELAQDRPHQLDILLGWTTLGPADMVVSQ